MKGWALVLVVVAAIVGLVLYLYKQGVFALNAPPPGGHTPAPPFGGNLGPNELLPATGASALGTLYGSAYQGACTVATGGSAGPLCGVAGQVGVTVGDKVIPKVASTAKKAAGYHPVVLAGKGAKKLWDKVF